MATELSQPKLLFRIVDCFNPGLEAHFTQEHKDFKQWTFNTIFQFINKQISNLQYKERHSYDISAVLDEEERRYGGMRPNQTKEQNKAKTNNSR